MTEFYLVSSLPVLTFGQFSPLTISQFLRSAEGVVSESDLQDLRLIFAGRSEDAENPCVRAWHDKDTQIRNAVARHRASVIGPEAQARDRMHAGFSVWIENEVQQAFSRSNPRKRERGLDHIRWNAAGEIMQSDPYGFGYVTGYAVQLQIAQRWAGLTNEKGKTEVGLLVEHNIRQVREWA